ncbi:MAG TPA: hypothetical protein VLV54_00820 [Thermoanaerobaculia bacterium]|nr:hypothetical protein [Thermoanaerobaculia bacterium]
MPRTRRDHTFGTWGTLTTTVTPEVTRGLPHLEWIRAKLVATETEANELVIERDYHQAQKQEATRKLQIALEEGRRTAHALRLGLRAHFGPTNEALAAFGMQPFRGRKRSKTTETPDDASENSGGETLEPSGTSST